MANPRPSFDDKNPTISDPVHGTSGPDGFSGDEMCSKMPPGWVCTLPAGHEGPCAAVSESPATPDEGVPATDPAALNEGAGVLFDGTKRRMVILLSALVKLAESGDFALWCPLAAMDETFRSLDWTSVPPMAVAKFYKLVAMTLTSYGVKLDAHAMAVMQSIRDSQPLPELPVWAGDDTLKMYDMVESIFEPAAPPAEEGAQP